MEMHNFSYKKSLGQNFIYDENFLTSIVKEIGITPQDTIVEIGAGAGTLTKALAKSAKRVISYELDNRLQPILQKNLSGLENIELHFEDALKAKNFPDNFKLVANIPYYITTPLLLKFIRMPACTEICVLVQEELAQRIVAKCGTKEYGALSITMQTAHSAAQSKNPNLDNPYPAHSAAQSKNPNLDNPYPAHSAAQSKKPNLDNPYPAHSAAQSKKPNLDNPYPAHSAAQSKKPNLDNSLTMGQCRIIKRVPRKMFTPPPNVDSAFVLIRKNFSTGQKDSQTTFNPSAALSETFDNLVKGMFSARRKTVLNALKQTLKIDTPLAKQLLQQAGIDETVRPEQIPPDKFVKLSQIITETSI